MFSDSRVIHGGNYSGTVTVFNSGYFRLICFSHYFNERSFALLSGYSDFCLLSINNIL